MKQRLRRLILLIALAMLLAWNMRSFVAAQESAEFFPETGHWVSDEFLAKYNSVANSQRLFGLPITDAFRDEETGLLIQYFEKTRFELHPDAPADLQVQLTPIGEYLYQPGEPLAAPPNFPSCRYFTETDHKVCYAFLDFFEDHGGVAQFGYPISGFEIHDGWISQYFQRARFEWHPELPAGEQVVLADLGIRFFQFRGENPALLQPNTSDAIPLQTITSLQAHAFASKPVTPTSSEQSFHVIVFDQSFHPVENASVTLVIHLPGREPVSVEARPTNGIGWSLHQITFEDAQPGTANVTVTVSYEDIVKKTRTSFQIW
jgi:hypothetical protein